jgi:septum formation protein
MTSELILASASPRRLALLEQIGIKPARVDPADIDESVRPRELPRPHALRIATEKAHAVHARTPGAVILAADTVVACGRRILPKAEDDATVTKCLSLLSGRRHTVITAVALIDIAGRLKKLPPMCNLPRVWAKPAATRFKAARPRSCGRSTGHTPTSSAFR